MALVYLKMVATDEEKEGVIINTKNIESIFKLGSMNKPKFKVYLVNGEDFDFNQLYYQGNFVNVYKTDQLYKLLTKLDSGVIQDGSA